MASGCAVLSSNAASLPEVVGPDAGIYFAPESTEQMSEAMTRIADERGLKERLRTAGIQRAAAFTWKNTAAQTLPVLTAW
jgi:glycosyltransferase involved in cell wall biosynthesis